MTVRQLRKGNLSDESKVLWEKIRGRGLMTWPESKVADDLQNLALKQELQSGPVTIDHPFFDMRVYVDTVIGDTLVNLILCGDYELMDLDLFDLYIKPNDLVVDVGGGIGISAAFCAKKSLKPVVIVEANSSLHSLIAAQARVNSVDLIPLHAAIVADSKANGTLDFHFHEEFWRSTANPSDGEYRKVERVPAIGLNSLLKRHPCDVLIIDIEGAEVGLFDEDLAYKPRLIFVEIHVPNIAEQRASTVFARLAAQGYSLIDFRAWMFAFERRN